MLAHESTSGPRRAAAGDDRARVLFVTNEMPHFTGGGMPIRDYNLLKALAHRYAFTVLCFRDGDGAFDHRARKLRQSCEDIVGVPRVPGCVGRLGARVRALVRALDPVPWHVRELAPRAIAAHVRELVRQRSFDIVHANHVEMGALLSLAGGAARVVGIEAVTPKLERLAALEVRRVRQAAWQIESRKFARYERSLYHSVDLCTVVSDEERQNVLCMAPEAKVAVVPNGVDTDFFQFGPPASQSEGSQAFLFIGSMGYLPNEDAVLHFHGRIWPELNRTLPSARLRIVGRDPSPAVQALASSAIEVLGWVEDIRPYMRASAALVVPLRSGGGTRLKILEAMAAGLPVVSTTVGAEGLDVCDGETILLADEPGQFAHAVVKLVSTPALGSRLRTNARRLVEQRYDWRIVARSLDQAYQSLLGRRAINEAQCNHTDAQSA